MSKRLFAVFAALMIVGMILTACGPKAASYECTDAIGCVDVAVARWCIALPDEEGFLAGCLIQDGPAFWSARSTLNRPATVPAAGAGE